MSKPKTTKKATKTTKTKAKTRAKTKPTTKKAAPPTPIKAGDFILADFIGYTQEDHRLFDTTKEDIARAEDVYDEQDTYTPRLIIVGEGWMVPGVDNALIGMHVGESKHVTLEPPQAFGLRDAQQVRIIPRARIKTDKKLVRGMRVTIGNQSGTIRHVGGGRVTVDFNPILAGHTIEYDITITKRLTSAKDKVEAFVYRRFTGVDKESLRITTKGKTLTIALSADPRLLLNQSLQIWKLGVTHDIETHMKDKYTKVLFTEEWEVASKESTSSS